MLKWKDISIFQFQQVEKINARKDLDDLDKILFILCIIYNYTEHQLDEEDPKKVQLMIQEVTKVFQTEFKTSIRKRFGKYLIEFNPEKLTYGQYVELAFFFQDKIGHAHYILSSLSRVPLLKYNSATHKKRAAYFSTMKVGEVLGTINRFMDRWVKFNAEYKALFDAQDGDTVLSNQELKKFNDRYGWIYSASVLAEYQRIPLDEVYKMPVRQALNALVYLKAKRKYELILSKLT